MEMITKALELLIKFGYARGSKRDGWTRKRLTRRRIAGVKKIIEIQAVLRLIERNFRGLLFGERNPWALAV